MLADVAVHVRDQREGTKEWPSISELLDHDDSKDGAYLPYSLEEEYETASESSNPELSIQWRELGSPSATYDDDDDLEPTPF